MKKYLAYKASQISYIRFGTGSLPVFCFHGYGEEASSFGFLEKYFGTRFSFFCIDLPFHGDTTWKEEDPFTIDDLQYIMDTIVDPVMSNRPLILMGYSLGGRMALALYEKMAFRTAKVVLLAPDGLKMNIWYWLSTQTMAGNKFFAFTMQKPGWFIRFLKMLNRLKLVNVSIFKFINYYIGNAEARRLLYARWTSLRKIKPGLKRIKSFISTRHTAIRLIYGKHDRIMLPARGEKFRTGIEETCSLVIINSGHQVLHEKHIEDISLALLH